MEKPNNILSYWYFRYLLITELFMVEKWERAMFHIVLFIILTALSLFNTTVIVGLVSYTTRTFLWSNGYVEINDNSVNIIQSEL